MMDAEIAALRARYVYTPEPKDRWTLLDAPEGPLTGDCEDWAYTVAWICAGRSWGRFWHMIWSREIEFWFVNFDDRPNSRHMTLFVKGRGWTDSYYWQWSAVPHHTPKKRYGVFKMARTLLLK
jgi:hypothetical protein